MNNQSREQYFAQFKADLARLIGCDPTEIPATTTKEIACDYLGLANPKTLNVWKSAGRHGCVMVRVGRNSYPSTDWLINLKMAGLSIPQEVA